MGGVETPHFHKPILYLSNMKLRPYQAPRRQPNINDMIYPKGSRQPGNVWVGAVVMNVQKDATPVTPTPTPSITPTSTVTPTPSITPTQTITPTNTVTPTQTVTPTSSLTPTPTITPTITPTSSLTPTPSITPTITPTSTITPTITPSTSPIPSGTTEANAYLTRVVTAGGTLNSTISAATRTLFTSLVSNNLYNKLYAFYPHLGGVSASHALNGKSTGNTITFNGGWTFDLTSGSKPNGTNGYGNILNGAPNQFGSQNSSAVGALLTTVATGLGSTDIGAMGSSSVRYYFSPHFSTAERPRMALNNLGADSFTTLSSAVCTAIQSRTGSTTIELYSEGSLVQTATRTSAAPDGAVLVIGAENENGIVKNYSPRGQGFTFLSSGLSGAEASTLTTIIKTWASAISRTN